MRDIDRLDPNHDSFHRSWFPVALAREVTAEQPHGVDLLGTRVVAWRDPSGAAIVHSSWCPHLGADLSQGAMIEGQLRCPYHHWRFDRSGACAHIPTGDKIPPGARIFTFPTAEAWGLVWAFNGTQPLFPPPAIPGITEKDLALETCARGVRPVPPWVATSNGVDFQHLRALHGLRTGTPDSVDVGAYAIEYCIETDSYLQHGRISGTNVFAQHLRREGIDTYMMFAGAPIDAQRSRGFFVVGVPTGGDSPAERGRTAAQLAGVRRFVEQLLAEDDPVLNTMRFKVGVLSASDRHLARYFKYVAAFPRGEVPE
jgi:phenylpropionate dioxygenase-like ring-hydroxylating dioxygenase large terminal subunit